MTECVELVRQCGTASDSPPWVLIHGWGFDERIWQPLLDQAGDQAVLLVRLNYLSAEPADYRDALAALLPDQAVIIGWSLGGMLALTYAQQYPERVSAVITLAANARFVANEAWPQAMAPVVFNRFKTGVDKTPDKQLRKFCQLVAKGSENAAGIAHQLEGLIANSADLSTGLDLLNAMDVTQAQVLSTPLLSLLGEGDTLVPAGSASDLAYLYRGAGQIVEVQANCGHFLLDDCAWLFSRIQRFLEALSE